MKRVLIRGAAALPLLALLPVAVFAQASITGVVKDTSGAVLPGVTVEAASPALIEKTRGTVTDGSGAYQIINLLPGTYTVTFTLPGFNTFVRDQIELSGSFVATVNADMRVGALAETITVTGQTPLVDVRSSAVQKVVTKEIVDSIPTGRLGINLAALQPGIILGAGGGVGQANTNALTSQDVGGTAGDTFTDLAIHGGKPAEQRQTIGGLSAATTIRFGESLSSSPSFTAMQEMSVNTSGADASLAGGGVQINYVPRDGGNTFKGLMFFSGANGAMQGTNYSSGSRDATGACTPAESLYCRGLIAQPGALKSVYDVNPGYGGPVMRDRLWWFATARWTKAENYVPNNYPNQNFVPGQTNPLLLNTATLSYVPVTGEDLRTTVGGGGNFWEQTVRLTWQMTEKNKLAIYYNNKKRTSLNANTTTSYESLNSSYFFPFSDNLVQWSAPMTNRLLLEAGFWRHQETWGGKRADATVADPLAIGVTDDVDGIGAGPSARQQAIELRECLRRQFGKRAAKIEQTIDRQYTDTSAIGENCESTSLKGPDVVDGLCRSEKLSQIHDAKKAGAPECRVVYLIHAGHCAGVSRGGLGGPLVPSRFENNDGLYPSSRARCAHEFARIRDSFNIEENGPCAPVQRKIVEQVTEVDIQRVAQRNDATEARTLGGGPFDHRSYDSTGLRDQRQVASLRGFRDEAGIQSGMGRQKADPVRTDDPKAVLVGHGAALIGEGTWSMTEPCRDDHGRAAANLAGLANDRRNYRGWSRDDHEVGRRGEGGEMRNGRGAVDFRMLGIDDEERSSKATVLQIFKHLATE